MKRIMINLSRRQLSWYSSGQLIKTYPVAIGKPTTPTPSGIYRVVNKIMHPGGVLGTRWMGLDIPTTGGPYGIHGTNNPSSIGKAVSNGCIRMYNRDVEELFPQVSIGTTVEISGSYGGTHPNQSDPKPGSTYTVRPGDTLWNMAQKHGITLEALIKVNNIKNPDYIYPGQILTIPQK